MQNLQEKITEIAHRAISEKVFPGVAISVFSALNPENNAQVYAGKHTYNSIEPVTAASMYDLASLTKCILHLAVNKLAELGKIDYTEKVWRLLGLTGKGTELIEVRHLMTFTVDFDISTPFHELYIHGQKSKFYDQEIMSIVQKADLRSKPGEVHIYRDISSILLSMYLETKLQIPLRDIFNVYLFKPVGVRGICFDPLHMVSPECVVPAEEKNLIRTLAKGEVHDETAMMLRPMNVGCAGLFGRLSEIEKFFQRVVLMNYHPQATNQFFNERTRKLIIEDQLGIPGHAFTYGFDKLEPFTRNYTHCQCFNANAIIFTGFTGASVMIDPIRWHTQIIILSNRTYPMRTTNEGIKAFRREIANAVIPI